MGFFCRQYGPPPISPPPPTFSNFYLTLSSLPEISSIFQRTKWKPYCLRTLISFIIFLFQDFFWRHGSFDLKLRVCLKPFEGTKIAESALLYPISEYPSSMDCLFSLAREGQRAWLQIEANGCSCVQHEEIFFFVLGFFRSSALKTQHKSLFQKVQDRRMVISFPFQVLGIFGVFFVFTLNMFLNLKQHEKSQGDFLWR